MSNEQAESLSQPPVRSIVRLIVTNSSLIAALLFYMGWAYENAFYGYFHLDPLDFGAGISNYVLHSLGLFSPALVIVAVAAIILISVRVELSSRPGGLFKSLIREAAARRRNSQAVSCRWTLDSATAPALESVFSQY